MVEPGSSLEVADVEFDDGVLAVKGVNLDGVAIQVSEEREMFSAGPQP